MFLRESDSDKKLYCVICANWEACTEADNVDDAAALAIETAYEKYDKDMCLSPTVSVMDLTAIHESIDAVEHIHLLFTPDVLANAGLYDLSKNFKNIIEKTTE